MNSEQATELVSELAAIYALSALDEAEPSRLECELGDLPEFQVEVAEFEAVAAMLAYGADPMPMGASLKERLFQKIASDETSDEKPNNDSMAVLRQQAKLADWQPYGYTPGVLIAKLSLDTQKRRIECFVQSLGPVKFPQHRHADSEEIMVLEGDLVIGDRIYTAGDRIFSQSGTVHQPETLNGCTLLLRTSLDDEILL